MRKHLFPAPFKRGAAARSRHTATLVALSFGLLAGPALLAAGPTGLPPPGQYRIDAETTTTSRAGPTTLESVQRIDGPTGRVTLTQKSSVDAASVTTQTANGQRHVAEPLVRVQGPRSAAGQAGTRGLPERVALRHTGRLEPGRRLQRGPGRRAVAPHRRAHLGALVDHPAVGYRTWLCAEQHAEGGAGACDARNEARERVRAQDDLTAMPGAADMADAHDTSVAMLEQQVNSGSAKKTAVARQHLKVLRDVSGGSTDPVVRIKERWSHTAYTCSAGS